MVKFLDRLFSKIVPQVVGSPVVRYSYPNYLERNITPEMMAADREIPSVLSAMVGLSRTCFLGFEWNLKSIEEGDDTKKVQIDKAKAEIKRVDKRIGRIGKLRCQGTLGLVRYAALEDWTWCKSLFEYAVFQEGNWLNFSEIQALPGQSFNKTPSSLTGQDRYIADKILPGIVFDSQDDVTHFYQNKKSYNEPIEISADNMLYIEDVTVPAGTSMMKVIASTVEQLKDIRRDGMLTMHNIGVPRETAQLDADAVAKLKEAGLTIDLAALQKYAKELVEGQSTEQAELSILGMKLQDRKLSVPLNPWEVDAYLKKEILDYFFHKDVLEVTAQAISATNAPTKDLLDDHIASEREIHGHPFELLWDGWLETNGFELVCEFDWWDWAPKDQEALVRQTLMKVNSGVTLINDARKAMGDREYTEEEIAQLIEERKAIKASGGGFGAGIGQGQPAAE